MMTEQSVVPWCGTILAGWCAAQLVLYSVVAANTVSTGASFRGYHAGNHTRRVTLRLPLMQRSRLLPDRPTCRRPTDTQAGADYHLSIFPLRSWSGVVCDKRLRPACSANHSTMYIFCCPTWSTSRPPYRRVEPTYTAMVHMFAFDSCRLSGRQAFRSKRVLGCATTSTERQRRL